jgi:hypothetical protein
MKVYTWVEWKEKFKREADGSKQIQHNLDCTGLIKFDDVADELHKLRLQLNDCETFFDMLWNDYTLSKLFRTDLAKVRCSLCGIDGCSVRNDPEECLRIIETIASSPVTADRQA